MSPSLVPSNQPSVAPTNKPSPGPSLQPTFAPTFIPSMIPTQAPSECVDDPDWFVYGHFACDTVTSIVTQIQTNHTGFDFCDFINNIIDDPPRYFRISHP